MTWRELFVEYDITMTMQSIRDHIKNNLLEEGFSKREANRLLKGLSFKEKICNTRTQAQEFLRTLSTAYAIKYKIGINPSPKVSALEKRLLHKITQRDLYIREQEEKWSVPFLSCSHCRSRINRAYANPPDCPVCKKDLRNSASLAKAARLEKAVGDARTRYEHAARLYNSRFTGGERWIIRLINPFITESPPKT